MLMCYYGLWYVCDWLSVPIAVHGSAQPWHREHERPIDEEKGSLAGERLPFDARSESAWLEDHMW